MAGVAEFSGRAVLFPEGVALAWGAWTMHRPDWHALGPRLGLAPVLCAACGLAAAVLLPSRLPAELAALTAAAVVIAVLRAPVGPALSAAVLPAVAGVRSGWYLLSVCIVAAAVLAGSRALDQLTPVRPGGTDPASARAPGAALVTWIACAAWLSTAACLALPLAAAAPPLLASTSEWVSGQPKGARAGARLGMLLTVVWAAGAATARQVRLLPAAAAMAMLIAAAAMSAARVAHPPAVAIALVPMVFGPPATWGALLAGACSVAAAVTVLYLSGAAGSRLAAGWHVRQPHLPRLRMSLGATSLRQSTKAANRSQP
jgi:hypothetical protein